MYGQKYILELYPEEVKAIYKAIRYLHDEYLENTMHFCETVLEQEPNITPCTLLSTNPLDQMSAYPVPDPDKE